MNRDGKPDYLLFNAATRQTDVWYLNNVTFIGSAFGPSLPPGWTLVTATDFNGDGKRDYLLFNAGARQTAIYYLNGTNYAGSSYGPTLPAN